MKTIQFDRFRDTDSSVDLATHDVVTAAASPLEDALPVRRRQRARHPRRPPSGLTAVVPALVSSAGCDVNGEPNNTEPYRMGRWARLAVTMTVVSAAVVIALSVMLTDPTGGTAPLTVAAGDTLWTIAERVAPDENPWSVIDEITALNGLTSNVIVPGQVLVVPAG